jgi:steroid delta-isomerase-like uncharacterized protein
MATTGATTERSVMNVSRAVVLEYNRKDWQACRAVMASDYVYDEIATHRRAQGADNVLAIWRGWATAFPDSHGEIHNSFIAGDTAITELTWTGTHSGPLQTADGTVAPTGRRIEMRACQITTVKDGKATVTRHYFDLSTMLRQLGVGS